MTRERRETVIIGGGQSGLAISYCLTQLGRDHVILERGRLGERWRMRWDSVSLQFANFRVRLPGYPYQGDNPDGFKNREDVVGWLEEYAAFFHAPIRCGVEVTALRQHPGSDHFLLQTTAEDMEAANVVIATGPYQLPAIPPLRAGVPADVLQLHTDQYQNPGQLPPGAVLVVGSGASGSQIADELLISGRKVYLCAGRHRRQPRRYRGKDSGWWTEQMTKAEPATVPAEVRGLGAGRPPSVLLTGVRGGYDINLREYAARGMVLLGRLLAIQDGNLVLAPDLEDNLAQADEAYWSFRTRVDDFITRHGIAAPQEDPPVEPPLPVGEAAVPILQLDLHAAGITTVLWATGYRYDFGWVQLPVFDARGDPIQRRGVTDFPGLYFLGLRGISRSSSAFDGMSDDAAYLADQIAQRTTQQ